MLYYLKMFYFWKKSDIIEIVKKLFLIAHPAYSLFAYLIFLCIFGRFPSDKSVSARENVRLRLIFRRKKFSSRMNVPRALLDR